MKGGSGNRTKTIVATQNRRRRKAAESMTSMTSRAEGHSFLVLSGGLRKKKLKKQLLTLNFLLTDLLTAILFPLYPIFNCSSVSGLT